MNTIQINAAVEVAPADKEPLHLTESIGTLEGGDEKIEVLRSITGLTLILRGEKLVGTINLKPLIQEAALHVAKANA